jgi:hypothetical protein
VLSNGGNKQRSHNARDTVDWEAVRQAEVREISETIRERGMNNMLAERIKVSLIEGSSPKTSSHSSIYPYFNLPLNHFNVLTIFCAGIPGPIGDRSWKH